MPVTANRYRLVLTSLAFLLVGAVAFEFTVRVEDWVRFGVRLDSPYRSQSELLVRDARGLHGRANAVFEKWRMNNVGTRGPDVAPPRAAGRVRVIVVGASESFGLYESPDREYPRVLEERLNSTTTPSTCAASSRNSWEVLNAAFPGMSLPTIEQDLRLRLSELRPDVVIVYPTPVTYLSEASPLAARPDSGTADRAPSPLAALRLRGMRRLRSSFKDLLPERALDIGRQLMIGAERAESRDSVVLSSVPTDRLDRYAEDMASLIRTIHSIGAKAVVVAHLNAFTPNDSRDPIMLRAWERFYPQAEGDVIVAFDSIARPLTQTVAVRSGAFFLDASETLRRLGRSGFADYAHFSDSGAEALADTLAKSLLADSTIGSLRCSVAP